MLSLLFDYVLWNSHKKMLQVDTDKKVEGDGESKGLPPGHAGVAGAEKVNGSSCPFSGKTKPEESKKTS